MDRVDWSAEAAWYSDLIRNTPSGADRDVIVVPDHPHVLCLYVPGRDHDRLRTMLTAAGFEILGSACAAEDGGKEVVTMLVRCTEPETLSTIVKTVDGKP